MPCPSSTIAEEYAVLRTLKLQKASQVLTSSGGHNDDVLEGSRGPGGETVKAYFRIDGILESSSAKLKAGR